MKDSGVEWIGEIPEAWKVIKVKNVYKTHKDIVGENAHKFERLALTLKGVIKRPKEDSKGLQSESFETYQIIFKNDLVFKLIDLENVKTSRIGISPYMGLVSPVYIALTNEKEARFGYYYFLSMWHREIFNKLGRIGVRSALNVKDLINLPYPIFFDGEEVRIANYLDCKTTRIDQTIEKQKQVIEKLKEYKQSVITEAVTKGLNPNVPMKDSGVEWIGEIPEHWKISKINKVTKTSSGSTPLRNKNTEYFENANIKWIRTLDLSDGDVFDSSDKITEEALNQSSCSIMPINTIMVAMYGGAGTIGKCGIMKNEATTNQAICSMVCNKYARPYYLLNTLIALRSYWMKFAVGTRKDPNISQEIVGRMLIPLPTYEEQIYIAEELEIKKQEIDKVIEKKHKVIEKLESYKKSLIYECVTGKREVE